MSRGGRASDVSTILGCPTELARAEAALSVTYGLVRDCRNFGVNGPTRQLG